MGTIIPKLRASARGQDCTLQISLRCDDVDTTVLAHLPSDVKGMGNKGDDWHAVFACASCHAAMDLRYTPGTTRDFYMLRGLQRTQKFWFDNGYLVIPGVLNTRAKQSSKIIAPKEMYR